jgi:preprotein translocase subunit SecG
MVFFFVLLIIVACVFLGLIILIQNPKGGGLASNVGGFSNQLMGVKQTTDVLEKGTWVLAVVVGLLCLFSAMFLPKSASNNTKTTEKSNGRSAQQQQQSAPAPANSTPFKGN